MSDKFTVEIISPDKLILNSEANEVTIPSYEGQMGILKNHIPLITFLRPGIIVIQAKEEKKYYVEEGTVEFSNDNLLILTSTAKELSSLDKNLIDDLLNQAEKKLAYQLFSGDLDEDLLITLSKGGKLTPEQAARQEDLGMADNISGATVDKILSLNADKVKAFRELGEDLRLSGLLDDDVFQTNLGTYLNRAYDYTKQNKGTEAASKFKKTKY